MPNTLLLPVAGQSSRYAGTRPKWLLTMPDGRLMIEKSVEQLAVADFERVIVICLREHVERYSEYQQLCGLLQDGITPDIELLMLDEPTSSQVDTIAQALKRQQVRGSFFVKDCDNTFSYDYGGGNEVAVVDLHSVQNVDAANKSYVQTDPLGVVNNIVEKHVIGNLFCCGGYGFADVEPFLRHWEKLRKNPTLYLSHVIFSMILEGVEFRAQEAHGYVDWGTLRDYRAYCDRHLVVFCDIDGVLFRNSSKFAPGGWSYQALQDNIAALRHIREHGSLYLVITTSRPESMRAELVATLEGLGIRPDQCVMGLPHGRRLLVNDFSATNPYPSAVAINLERDAEKLALLLSRYLPEAQRTAVVPPTAATVTAINERNSA